MSYSIFSQITKEILRIYSGVAHLGNSHATEV